MESCGHGRAARHHELQHCRPSRSFCLLLLPTMSTPRNGGTASRSFGRAFHSHVFRGEKPRGHLETFTVRLIASVFARTQVSKSCLIMDAVANLPGETVFQYRLKMPVSRVSAGSFADGLALYPATAPKRCRAALKSTLSLRTGVSLGEVDGCQCIIWDDPCIEACNPSPLSPCLPAKRRLCADSG